MDSSGLFSKKLERLSQGLKQFDKRPQDLEEDIHKLEEWIKTQKHLPEIPGKIVIFS